MSLLCKRDNTILNNSDQDNVSSINRKHVQLCKRMTELGVKPVHIRRALMDISHFTQLSLAEHVGVTRMAISGALRDQGSLALKVKVATALKVHVWDIYDVKVPH